jgi:heat shock protein HslJ
MFSTDRHYDVPPNGTQIDMMLVRTASQANGESASTATLENTYWKVLQLGDREVNVASEQREPYLVLHSDEQRVAGFGGCNRLTGSYSLSGDDLRFSQMAGTMMACAEGMEYEQALHDALGQVARWHIDGERLDLYDESGKLVARFESRYMK